VATIKPSGVKKLGTDNRGKDGDDDDRGDDDNRGDDDDSVG
jgi:hypothetical protein